MDSFKALLIEERDGKVVNGFVRMTPEQLDAGEVTIRVAYSSVNYKDALAATGAGKIIRRFPCVGGIDLSGTVIDSRDARFKPGDAVIATSFDIGVAHHGGYAEIARVPGDWVVPLPAGLSLYEAMALGTAGFTAALGIVRMEENGLRPEKGPVIVTGATGGVGSLAVDMLAKSSYHVVALTGKESESDYLRSLGAAEIMLRQNLDLAKIRPLDRARWAGAVDVVGSHTLANACATTRYHGAVAACGLAGGMDFPASVAPFILRGITLYGIDSVMAPRPLRQQAWARLAEDLDLTRLHLLTREVPLAQVVTLGDAFLAGQVRGRILVNVQG